MCLQARVSERHDDRLLRLSTLNKYGPRSQLIVSRVDVFESLPLSLECTVVLLHDDPDITLKKLHRQMMWVVRVRRDGLRRSLAGSMNIN